MTYDTINDAQTIAGSGEGTLLANRYRVVRQLGQGGMGSVWLAEDTQLDNKPFAIKMLPSIFVSNKRAYRQLKDEALVAMKLTHPNIVTLRAFEENNGNPFLVMDYIDGQTLDNYLADYCSREESEAGRARSPSGPPCGGLPEADVLRILRPIAAALDYAHTKGVVHRDVKPGNVMIAQDGTPYILDFGIAREIQETMTRVTGKLSSGTLLYMSPEQNNGDEPTAAQDIYSFAAMAYECLAGRPPFTRGNIEDQIKNKIPDPPPGGTQLVTSVMAGLAKKPEDRPPTCAAVLEGNGTSRVERIESVEARVPRSSSDDLPPVAVGGGVDVQSQSQQQEQASINHKAYKKYKVLCSEASTVIIASLLSVGIMCFVFGQLMKESRAEVTLVSALSFLLVTFLVPLLCYNLVGALILRKWYDLSVVVKTVTMASVLSSGVFIISATIMGGSDDADLFYGTLIVCHLLIVWLLHKELTTKRE